MADKQFSVEGCASMTNAQAIEALMEFYGVYQSLCGKVKTPDKYKYAMVKAVAALGFCDGFKTAIEKVKDGEIKL